MFFFFKNKKKRKRKERKDFIQCIMYVLGTTKRACELFITRSREIKSQISAKKKKNKPKEKTKKKKKIFKMWMEDSSTSERFAAISLEHTWKRTKKLWTRTLHLSRFHCSPPE